MERALHDVFLEAIEPNSGSSAVCRDAGWFQGYIKLIGCSGLHYMELHKAPISRIGEVWPGASLDAVSSDQIPHRSQSRANVSTGASTSEAI